MDNCNRNDKENTNQKQLSGQKRSMPEPYDDVNDGEDDQPNIKRAKLNSSESNNSNSNGIVVTAGEEMNNNCEWIGRLGDLDKHLKVCPLELIPCKHFARGCSEKIRRKDMASHLDICENAPIRCPKCVRIKISRGYLQKHLSNDCIMAEIDCGECLVACEYNKYGCALIKRKDEQKHNQDFTQHHLKLVTASHETMEQRVATLETRMAAIGHQQRQN